jgi:hypothetical protein
MSKGREDGENWEDCTTKGPLQCTEESPASGPFIGAVKRKEVIVEDVPQPGFEECPDPAALNKSFGIGAQSMNLALVSSLNSVQGHLDGNVATTQR